MASQSEKPNLSRRRLLQTAAVVPAAAVSTLAIASPAHASYNGEITRSNVKLRAQNWFERGIQYNMSGTATDYEGGHSYRRDCSGFVSMCWHSTAPGHSTRTLTDIAGQIPWDSLHPGDAVNSYDNHCMLFSTWSSTPGWFWMYDLATPELDMRHKEVSVATLKSQGYVPLRYHKIIAG